MTRLLALVWPELRIPDADPRPFDRMLDALDDLSPRVEAVDLGVALVDITGLEPMWGPERRIAARAVMLTRAVAPLRVRCGIGENRWLATLAARLARFERPDAPAALRDLASGSINVVFSVDLFNEGINVPVVDTVLFLRPTDSATLFLQQLGRGLRKSPGKSTCLVLDFVGQHRREFRFGRRLRVAAGSHACQRQHS